MSVSIGTTAPAATASDIILSIRDQIPDIVGDAGQDGNAFTLATLLRWLNDAGRIICTRATAIKDWYAIPSKSGMDLYELPQYIVNVEQAWYDLEPLTATPEADNTFITKVTGPSWWFGPHSIHATPRMQIWPAADRTGASSNLVNPTFSATDTQIEVISAAAYQAYGFVRIDNELITYRSVAGNILSNLLRGQGGTLAESHASGTPVVECNIMLKGTRLPKPLTKATDPIEIPQGLWPLLELYVLSKVREAEQESQVAAALRQEFNGLVDQLAEKSQLKGLKQGLQVRIAPPGLGLYGGRTYIP